MKDTIMDLIKKSEASKTAVFVIGGIIGILVFLLIYGYEVLIFTNVDWLTHSEDLEGLCDLTQHYYGWVFFRKTPWMFPLGLTEGVASEMISVAYTDAIPLFAIFFKALSPWLPQNFQYFGLFEFITYFLMGALGALITYRYTHKLWVNGVSALLFVLSPVLLKRAFYHTALSAHFVILAAICLWIYREEIRQSTYILYWTILAMLCTAINPYYVPMVLGVLLCSLLQEFIVRKEIGYALFCALIPAVSSLLIGYPIGLFYGEVSAAGEGIEKVSFNLNQLINPRNYNMQHENLDFSFVQESYSLFFKGFDLASDWQHEGFAYLGMGILLLVCIAATMGIRNFWILRKEQQIRREGMSYICSILVGMLGFTLLALGPVATAGTHTLYTIPWPEEIYRLFCVFRTAGRLIWPVYFGLMALSLISLIHYIKSERVLAFLLAAAVIVQMIDISPAMRQKHQIYTSEIVDASEKYDGNTLMNSALWEYLGDQCDEIIFGVSTHMTICFSPYWSVRFQQFADAYDIRLSASYCSRDISMAADAYAEENFCSRRAGAEYPHVIYVFLYEDMLDNAPDMHLNYYRYENIVIGTDLDLGEYANETQKIPTF